MDKIDFKKEFYHNIDIFLNLLSINSVYDENSVGNTNPYGRGVKKALDYMYDICDSAGFTMNSYNNSVISASYGSGKRIDIASHLDVVNEGVGWTYNPFEGKVIGDKIYGRGSQDMKSGAFLTYLALKMIKDRNIKLKNEIRLVFGSDEERTMQDLKDYINIVSYPDFAFSPDGIFPIAIGEFGALMWTFNDYYDGIVESFDCGVQPNVVSPIANAIIKDNNLELINNYLKTNNFNGEACIIDNKINIKIIGKSSHASKPFDGIDATVLLLKLIADIYKDEYIKKLYDFFSDPNGSKANMGYDIEPMGKLTLICGVLKLENNNLKMLVDSRYPYGISADELTLIFKNVFKKASIELSYNDDPTLLSKDNKYVQVLMNNYKKVYKDDADCFISGGVSYSKIYKNCVTFGPVGTNSNLLAHQKDEYILIDDCIKALEIYYYSLIDLGNI